LQADFPDADAVAALEAAEAVLTADPLHLQALQVSAAALRSLGRHDAAERSEAALISRLRELPGVAAATEALSGGRSAEAQQVLSLHLREHLNNPVALEMLAGLALRMGQLGNAEALLRRALTCAPGYVASRKTLVRLLRHQNRWDEAIALLDDGLTSATNAAELLYLKSALLGRVGRVEEALSASFASVALAPDNAVTWLSHTRLLAQVGRRAEAGEGARRAIAVNPEFGPAWWTLADLDPAAVTDADISAMTTVVKRSDAEDRFGIPIHFALGRAWEHRGDGAMSFACYAEGHRLRRLRVPHDAQAISRAIRDDARSFDASFFRSRAGYGTSSAAPIFIVGMHRSGSSLVEQILASHPDVEGLAELPHLMQIAQRFGVREREYGGTYEQVARLDAKQASALGEYYLAGVKPYRRSNRPRFTDKMPGNWRHIALIQSILPNAKIIEVRRDPLDCCISNFCRYFANGQGHADDLDDLGRYYRDYVTFMDQLNSALPGRVHRVTYERLVDDLETEVRHLLTACDLDFDARCLRFFETERPVRTPSAQQVRKPINREGIGRAELFGPWLAPLREALAR
jgi:tetratricopeptide (TPR) repeat protein